jgi:hypothetical protein
VSEELPVATIGDWLGLPLRRPQTGEEADG